MRRRRLLVLAAPALLFASVFGGSPLAASGAGSQLSAAQTDSAYAASAARVRNVFATTLKTSCFTPEAPYFGSLGPNDGYDGMSLCARASTTGEDHGPYASQAGSNPGYEGWTDNTDPVGAFDFYGNFYFLSLPYQFYYNSDGSHNFQINQNKEPNPTVSPEVISVEVRRTAPDLQVTGSPSTTVTWTTWPPTMPRAASPTSNGSP